MKASRRGAKCSCGATHPERPKAAREGWTTSGPQHERVWWCPVCSAKRKEEEARRARENPAPHPDHYLMMAAIMGAAGWLPRVRRK